LFYMHMKVLWSMKNGFWFEIDMKFLWQWQWRMASSGILCRVALVRTDVSEGLSAAIIRVTRISELRTSAITSNQRTQCCQLLVMADFVPSSPILVTLMMEAQSSSETSVLTRATRRNIPEDTIVHHCPCYAKGLWRRYMTQLPGAWALSTVQYCEGHSVSETGSLSIPSSGCCRHVLCWVP
jgi:hypothetical protein